MVDVTVTNDSATALQAAALPVVTVEETSMINMSIVLVTGVLVVLVLAMDAVIIAVKKMRAAMALTAQALDVSSMPLTDALLVVTELRAAAGGRPYMGHVPKTGPTRQAEWMEAATARPVGFRREGTARVGMCPETVTVEEAVAAQVTTLLVMIIFGVAKACALRVPARPRRSPVRPSAQREVPALWAGLWSCRILWLGLA